VSVGVIRGRLIVPPEVRNFCAPAGYFAQGLRTVSNVNFSAVGIQLHGMDVAD
jgi:hypothetical protein